jgi:hypothetical protein
VTTTRPEPDVADRGTGSPSTPPEESGAGWLRLLWGFVGPVRRLLVVSVGAALLTTAIVTATPLVSRIVVDDGLNPNGPGVGPWLVVLFALGILRFFATRARRWRAGRVSYDVQYRLRGRLFEHLVGLDPKALGSLRTGQLVSRASADLTLVQQFLAWGPQVVANVLQLVASIIAMLVLSWQIGLVALVVVPLSTILAARTRGEVFAASWDAQQREAELTNTVEEAVSGVRVVKGFGQEHAETNRVMDAVRSMYAGRMRANRLRAAFTATLQSVPALGQFGVLLEGGYLALHHELSLGTFLACTTYLVQLAAPARMIGAVVALGQQARAAVERLVGVLETEATLHESPAARPLPEGPGRVEFEGVSFRYTANGPTVLDDIDLELVPGEVVAVVGPSGSGKSTLAMLLPTACRCRTRRSTRCVPVSASRSKRPSCSPTPSGRTSPMAGPTRPTRRSAEPPTQPGPRSSSTSFPRATTPSSASADSHCPEASGSASRSPGCCSPTPTSRCSTTRRALWTPPSRPRSTMRFAAGTRTGRCFSSRTASRRRGWQTASSCSRRDGSSRAAHTTS